MNKKGAFILGTGTGFVIGAASMYFFIKKKVEERVDAEINEVIDRFKDRLDCIENKAKAAGLVIETNSNGIEFSKEEDVNQNEENESDDSNVNITNIRDAKAQAEYNKQQLEKIIKNQNNNQKSEENYTVEEDHNTIPPYIISEDEYGEFGNEEVPLMYYADGILADEEDNIASDIQDAVGNDAIKALNEDPYLETLYVRNEPRETDYVILRSEKEFKEIAPMEG